MDILFLFVIVFLLLLAVFDLSVGVSNDAVNFLNSAIGSKAAPFKRIIIVASIGVFLGASMSNGMMEIARHGIFRPEYFTFYELMCIFMAVVVTDIILLDMFNTLGMPTSTTVSMVFELFGATFVMALIKMSGGIEQGLSELLNTEKALTIIMGIFLSVAIAFVFGMIVQFVARMVFSFNYRRHLKWNIGIYGGICSTAIIYFMLIKGVKDLSFMTPDAKEWIGANTSLILGGCFAVFTVLMQLLHALKVNVLKIVVLMGTFALAMAFAGNDLVNFIGVPLSGLASYQDYIANGGGDAHGYLMNSLNGPADTPVVFLIAAGVIMVVALSTSKKTRNVSKTEIGLGSQQGGDEIFGSSRIARRLVRWTISLFYWVRDNTPRNVRAWFNRRFNIDEMIMEQGASFDLIRGSINLVLAGALIAFGTSLKLPLSTTFVTFMVAMGTSLADRAWGRESAVFRVTGVISVIGGWFLTAGAAFIGAGVIVVLMYVGGHWAMIGLAVLTIFIIVRSNRRFRMKKAEDDGDTLFQTILTTDDKTRTWELLLIYVMEQQKKFLRFAEESYGKITDAFINENAGTLGKTEASLLRSKSMLKNARRKETLCLRRVSHEMAIEKNAWFHLSNNCCMNVLYNLRRINEICREHVDNNFHPLPSRYISEFEVMRGHISVLFTEVFDMVNNGTSEQVPVLRRRCDDIKDMLSDTYHRLYRQLREVDPSSMTVMYVYINMLQETQEMVSALRKYIRAYAKLHDSDFSSRKKGTVANQWGKVR